MVNEDELKKMSDEINELMEKRTELIHQQYEILSSRIDGLKPVLDFLINKGISFSHQNPEINMVCYEGPILAFDSQNKKVYTYDVKARTVICFDNYTKREVEQINLYTLVELFDIDEMVESLNNLVNRPLEALSYYIQQCELRENTIKKLS